MVKGLITANQGKKLLLPLMSLIFATLTACAPVTADQKAEELIKRVRTVEYKEGILHREVGDYGVIASIKAPDGNFYSVNIRPNNQITIHKTGPSETDPENYSVLVIVTDFNSDGKVDHGTISTEAGANSREFDPSRNKNLELKGELQKTYTGSLDALLSFYQH